MTDVDGAQLPLAWNGTSSEALGVKPGTPVRLRIFFRAATIYAVGSS